MDINDHFDLPDNIKCYPGLTHDDVSGVLIVGWNRIGRDPACRGLGGAGLPEVKAESPSDRTFPAMGAKIQQEKLGLLPPPPPPPFDRGEDRRKAVRDL